VDTAQALAVIAVPFLGTCLSPVRERLKILSVGRWFSMRAAGSMSLYVTLLSIALLHCFMGCGGAGSQSSDGDDEYVAESIEVFEAATALDPGTSGLDETSREQGLLFRINLLKTLGERAAAAVPALEKLRDATQNPELKQAATDALAEIQE
jgi:hypothetical protein